MTDSGLVVTPENAERVGVCIGSGIGGLPLIEETHRIVLEKGPRRISPFFIPGLIVNMCSGLVSIQTGAKGPNSAIATACATSAHAIGDAANVIRRGDADAMIAGGSEAVITSLAVGGFSAMRALSTRNDDPKAASRPWDKDRDGFVLGEGAGILVLEDMGLAKARGAPIYAELAGYGMSGDAYHISAPSEDGDGPFRVMRNTLLDAGVNPEDVAYVNAHGTSTPHGDRIETIAIKRVFGEHVRALSVSSTKSMTGHLLGAAGGFEAGVLALAMRHGVIPPTINYKTPDPDCDLDYTPNTARERKLPSRPFEFLRVRRDERQPPHAPRLRKGIEIRRVIVVAAAALALAILAAGFFVLREGGPSRGASERTSRASCRRDGSAKPWRRSRRARTARERRRTRRSLTRSRGG